MEKHPMVRPLYFIALCCIPALNLHAQTGVSEITSILDEFQDHRAQQAAAYAREVALETTAVSLNNIGGKLADFFVIHSSGYKRPIAASSDISLLRELEGDARINKLKQELSALPPSDAAKLINEKLEFFSNAHLPLFANLAEEMRLEAELQKSEEEMRRRAMHCGSATITWTGAPAEHDAKFCARAVLALIYLAGTQNLVDCREKVQQIIAQAQHQRNICYDPLLPDSFAAAVIINESFYNRAILAIGLQGTGGRPIQELSTILTNMPLDDASFEAFVQPQLSVSAAS